MSYDYRNRVCGEVATGDLEGSHGCDCSGAGGERRSGDDGKGGVRLVASADAGDSVDDGRLRKLGKTVKGRRKAFQDAMAWLFSPERNPDAWMIKREDKFIIYKH